MAIKRVLVPLNGVGILVMTNLDQNSINWFGEFSDSTQESAFRNDNLDYVKKFNITAALVILAASMLLTLNDVGNDGVADSAFFGRASMALGAVFACWLAYKYHDWKTVYGGGYVLAVTIIVGTIMIDLSRPSDYLLHLGLDAVIVFAIYVAVPGVLAEILIAGGFTVAALWIHFNYKTPIYEMANVTVPITFVLAHTVGLAGSILHNRTRRMLFEAAISNDD